jgi:hypothetical protein
MRLAEILDWKGLKEKNKETERVQPALSVG